MMKLTRHSLLFSTLTLSFLVGSWAPLWGQGARVRSPYEAETEADRDHTEQREQWFSRGRLLKGKSAAELRYRAHQQKMQMRAARAAGRQIGPSPLNSASGQWTPLGPAPLASDSSGFGQQDYNWVSGRATAIAIDPSDTTGNTVYIGGAYGGVWKSSNGATGSPGSVTWTPVTDNQATLAVGSIAIQPGNANPANSLVLVGTGETNSSADAYYGLGILRSTNAGSTWSLITQSSDAVPRPFAGMGFSKIAFSTSNTSLVVAAAAAASKGIDEDLENPVTLNRGLYYSTDAGLTWKYASVKDTSTVIDPGSASSVVYNASAGKFFAAMRFHGIYSSS